MPLIPLALYQFVFISEHVYTSMRVCMCTYIAFIMLYTQTYIYLTSCICYIKYCVIIISILHF